MTSVLHILTRPADDWVRATIKAQSQLPDLKVEVIDLTQGTPDYAALVERVFASDSVASW